MGGTQNAYRLDRKLSSTRAFQRYITTLYCSIWCFGDYRKDNCCKNSNFARTPTYPCCGQPWVWRIFWKRTCDGLCRLQVFCGFGWNIKSSFNRKPGPLSDTLQAGAWLFPLPWKWPDYVGKLTHVAFLQFLPSGQYGLCFGYCFSGPFPLRTFSQRTGYHLRAICWSP